MPNRLLQLRKKKEKYEKHKQQIVTQYIATPDGMQVRQVALSGEYKFTYILNGILADKKKEELAVIPWVKGLHNQGQITPTMRTVLVDWLFALAH